MGFAFRTRAGGDTTRVSPVSSVHPLLSRLAGGRPLLLSCDPLAGLGARGVDVREPAELGAQVRDHAADFADFYHHEIGAGADVLCAATGETVPRALHRLGMAFRAAALTGAAIEMAIDAAEVAPRPVLVAGLLGSRALAPGLAERVAEELDTHAARLVAAGCELILARGFGQATPEARCRSRDAAVASAAATGVPTWAVVAIGPARDSVAEGALVDAASAAAASGASAILFDIEPHDAPAGLAALVDRLCATTRVPIGVLLAASGEVAAPDAWAEAARALLDAGARALGGGVGATARHLATLSASLRKGERSSLFPPAP
ncbi:MAG TPA: homocysteine S-methyltransferase family protein [Byssovorax sp.]